MKRLGMKKRYLLILVFVFLLASALFASLAVTPENIVVKRSDAALVQLVAFNGTLGSGFGQKVLQKDMNSDGYTDLIVGAPYKNISGGATDYTGQVYIFYGNSQGLRSYASSQANVTYNGTFKSLFWDKYAG